MEADGWSVKMVIDCEDDDSVLKEKGHQDHVLSNHVAFDAVVEFDNDDGDNDDDEDNDADDGGIWVVDDKEKLVDKV